MHILHVLSHSPCILGCHWLLPRTYKGLEEQSRQQEEKMEKCAKDTTFLHSKAQEYAKLLSKLKACLFLCAFCYALIYR